MSLGRHGFWGIFLLAAWPNALFDLCGICCGHFLMPFWQFFGATLMGKALVKVRPCGFVLHARHCMFFGHPLVLHARHCMFFGHPLPVLHAQRRSGHSGASCELSHPDAHFYFTAQQC